VSVLPSSERPVIQPSGPTLLGRDAEIGSLTEAIEARRPTLVVGEAGIGKTSVLRAAAARSGREVFEGGALATLSWMSYLPFERAIGRSMPDGDRALAASFVESSIGVGLLLLDDLQWADAYTLAILDLLAHRIPLLGAVRSGDPGTEMALHRAKEAGFDVVPLPPLEPEHAVSLVRLRNPRLDDRQVDAVVAEAAGIPFFLEELSSGPLTESAHVALRVRLHSLSAGARRCLGLLALLGRPAPEDLLGPEANEILASDIAVPEGPMIVLRHLLLGEIAVGSLSAEETRELHSVLAGSVDDPGEAARHHAAAGDLTLAYELAMEAADRALRPGERARHLGLAATCAEGGDADELRLTAAEAQIDAGEFEEALALTGSVTSQEPEVRAEVCLLRSRAVWSIEDGPAVDLALGEGLALVGGSQSSLELRLLEHHARVEIWRWKVEEGLSLAREAVRLSERLRERRAASLCQLGAALFRAYRPGDAVRYLRRSVRAAVKEGDTATEMEAAIELVGALDSEGETGAAERVAFTYVRRARDLGLLGPEALFRFHLTYIDLFERGDYRHVIPALQELSGGVALLAGVRAEATTLLALALADVGRAPEGRRLAEELLAQDHVPIDPAFVFHVLSEIELLAGRFGRAIELAEQTVASSEGLEVSQYPLFSAMIRGWASWHLGDRFSVSVVPAPLPIFGGCEAELRALATFADRRWDRAERAFEAAASEHRRIGGDFRALQRCLWAAGEAALQAGAVDRARERLLAVEAEVAAHGMAPLLGWVQRSLRRAGVRRSVARESGGVVTGRQRAILELVAEGMTSRDIAASLGLSRATVDSSIRSAMSRLDARTRVEAAAIALSEPSYPT